MKGYRIFITVFVLLFVLYIIAELNRPTPLNWTITLSKGDKNPYGGYVLYNRLRDIFPGANVASYRTPVYNQLNDYNESNSAYLLIGQSLDLSENDVAEMMDYVARGNVMFISASNLPQQLYDTLDIETQMFFTATSNDSIGINFTDPSLKATQDYTFKKMTLDEYFSKFDSAKTKVLGVNNRGKANFLNIRHATGTFFVHANPLVFSNYFLLHQRNADYTAKALSHMSPGIGRIYWDEYYKLGPEGAATPLRFFLSNIYLSWALRLAVAGLLLFVLFEMKRRQRVIPVITPLRNTTLNFVQTIATVYLQQKDNRSIALKKITYFLEFIRNRYFLATNHLNSEFAEHLSRKSGVNKAQTEQLVQMITDVQMAPQVNDSSLLMLNHNIDQFYKQVQ